MKKLGIVGSGLGGLALAIRMAAKGWQVTVFEANEYPGGKASQLNLAGFRFDAGPSLFTMPKLVDELFELAGKKPEAYFRYKKLPEVCRYFWEDGTRLSADADIEQFDKTVAQVLGERMGSVKAYLDDSTLKYNILHPLFLERSLHKIGTWVSCDAFRGYFNLRKMGVLGSLNRHNASFFENPKTVQLFNRYATYNGSDPYQTPATMSIIPHLEYKIGAFMPTEGIHQIAESLFRLAQEMGVAFHFGSCVKEIEVRNNTARRLKLEQGVSEDFDAIASNMDIHATYRKLMPAQKAPDFVLNQEKSGSALIFYWGLNTQFDELGLHNIFFSDNYLQEFDFQFKKASIYTDPTVYINISSKHIKTDAPSGGENWFVLINAPTNTGQDWATIISETRTQVLSKLERILGKDIQKHILCEEVLDPRTIEVKTSSCQGALYGNSSNNRFSAFLRHANFSSKLPNLYFVGGSVHPGGGIPLALMSAKITSDLIK